MPFLREQVKIINDLIKSSSLKDKRFQGGRLETIAELAHRDTGEVKDMLPVIVTDENVINYIGIDDSFPITIYHRVLGFNYGRANAQFGEGFQEIIDRADMLMVVWGKRSKLKLHKEELEALITNNFPDVIDESLLTPIQLDAMTVNLVSSNMNSFQVFGGEYKTDYFLGAEDLFFSIRYQIESRYRKGCFNIC